MLLPVFLPKAPKVLGDIVGSIAGAILIDIYLNLDAVWDIFKSLFSPIVTPDNLELPHLRELSELCSYFGYFIHTKSMKKGEEVITELTVQLKDDLLVGCGRDKDMKTAKAQAALCLLKQLKDNGYLENNSKLTNASNYSSNEDGQRGPQDCSFQALQNATFLHMGEQRTDKKSAQDSTALVLLLELKKQEIISIISTAN
ncbi:hypothetical protein MUK42_19700 [Musa troglodytarum]|uniref:Uncharacterized protein n=1 Tax=Musa troglodytarum TaxID=320322 RepID=A0A9E7FVF3_9LILI|nr:hypothetical protein MUK42_19700 [Musa troglodytarum]